MSAYKYEVPSYCGSDPIMKPVDDSSGKTVTFRAVSRDEEGSKRVTKYEVEPQNADTLKHIQKKLMDKGVHRHPVNGIPLNKKAAKSGHGGKFTWEGPAEVQLEDYAEGAIDENDPNYVDEEAEMSGVEELVVEGGVDVPKVAAQGVARVDVHPQLRRIEA
ncbi:hypothetical protein DM860_010399 [Cuscuta australis]|uniref:Uncharacterized protein n=1 Tax=Cuscuta australis TaxID=267555 RepID=A0A328E5G7_9ASTE|nr:hypothetical protein DM860_010399 [Cuscuta australis]